MTGMLVPDSCKSNHARQVRWAVGEFDDSLVVMPELEVERLAVLSDALRDATTWEDLFERIVDHPALVSEIRERCGDELLDEAEQFDAAAIPGFAEGAWPESPKEWMMRWLPDSIAKLGTVSPTLFGDDFLTVDPRRRREVVRAVRQAGHRCREDDHLISRASGAWRYG